MGCLSPTYFFKADKQFYLDQAKRLKETFNSKYPDYVYRRRPNNSRNKKRRPDATVNTLLDPSASGDAGDDFSAAHDFDYQSVDGQDLARDLAPSRGSSHSGVASGYDDNSSVPSPHPALSSFGYSGNNFPAGQVPSSGTRLRLSSIHDHPPSETPHLASLPSHHYSDTSIHSHAFPSHVSHPSNTTTSSSGYGSEHTGSSSLWGGASSSVRGDHSRTVLPTWASTPPVIPPLNVGEQLRERPSSAAHTKSEVYSHPSPRPWSTSTSQASPAISSASSHVSSRSSNSYPLQTLSSPFFPASHSPGAYPSSTSSSSPASENYYAPGSHLQGGSYEGRVGGGYEQQQYDSHSVPHSNTPHVSSAHEMLQLPHPQSRSSRPPTHSLAGMPPLGNPSTSNAAAYTNSGMDQWRTKIGGQ